MHQTPDHASWRISRWTTIKRESQPDIVPTAEVRARFHRDSRRRLSRKRAYLGTSFTGWTVSFMSTRSPIAVVEHDRTGHSNHWEEP
jgi:hypothetical protein